MPLYQTHLLTHLESFLWEDLSIDRTKIVENFAQAVVLARTADTLYNHPDTWSKTLNWGYFYQIFFPENLAHPPHWLRRGSIAHQFLENYFVFQPSNPNEMDWSQFSTEFADHNHGLIGCQMDISPAQGWLFDETTWWELHLTYLAQNPNFIDWSTNGVLPNLVYSNQHLCNLIGRIVSTVEVGNIFRNEISCTFPRGQGGEGQMIPIAREIARRNFYLEDLELSSKEQNRTRKQRCIFKTLKHGAWQYLSLDFEKCVFEVCDHHGQHRGEFRFDGQENGRNTKDTSGRHNISVFIK